jgi:hypothetical protein
MNNTYAFESEQQFVEFSYRDWNITLSDEIDYIGISIRHKSDSVGEDFYTSSLDEETASLLAKRWCDDYDNNNRGL